MNNNVKNNNLIPVVFDLTQEKTKYLYKSTVLRFSIIEVLLLNLYLKLSHYSAYIRF